MPKSIQNLATKISNKQKSGDIKDVATMGVLSALIVDPNVTAPLIGALVLVGRRYSSWGLSAFWVLVWVHINCSRFNNNKINIKIGPYQSL